MAQAFCFDKLLSLVANLHGHLSRRMLYFEKGEIRSDTRTQDLHAFTGFTPFDFDCVQDLILIHGSAPNPVFSWGWGMVGAR